MNLSAFLPFLRMPKEARAQIKGHVLLFIIVLLSLIYFLSKEESHSVLFESQESKSRRQGPVFNRIQLLSGSTKDIWVMNQVHDQMPQTQDFSKWDRIAIVIDKTQKPKVALFYQLKSTAEKELFSETEFEKNKIPITAACFTCHPNGPRVIRPNWESPTFSYGLRDRWLVKYWNFKIKSYGRVVSRNNSPEFAITFHLYEILNPQKLTLKSCTKCHNNNGLFGRGELTQLNAPTIKHMVDQGLMPPWPKSLTQKEKLEIKKFVDVF